MRRLGLCLSLSLLTFSGSDARSTRALTLTDKDFDTTTSADKLLVFSAVTSTQLPVSLGGEIGRDGEGEGTSRDERKKPYVLPPSPADLLRPDKFQFYTYNERGDMITRQMTEKEIQSLIAAGGGSHLPMDLHEPQKASDDALLTGGKKVADVVQKVQNLLKSAMDKKPSVITTSSSTISKIPEHATDEWSSILPSILSGEKLEPKPQYKPVVTSTESSLVTEEAAAMIPVVVISADEKLDHREDDPVFQKVNVIPAETTVNYDSSTTTFQKSSTLSTTLLTSTLKPTVLQSVETLSTELAGSLTSMISQVSEAVPPTLSIGQMPGIERNKLGTVDPSTTTIKTTVATADPTVTTVTANLSSVINKIIEESPVQNSTVLIEQVTLPNQAVYSVPVQHLASSLIAGFESTTNKPSLEVKAAPSKAEESSTTNINEFSTTLVPSTTTDDDEFSTEDIRTDPSFTTQPEKMVTISPFTEKTSTILIQTERIVTVTPLVENTSTILTYTKEEDDAEKEEDKETYGSTQSDGFTTLDYEAIDTTTALPFVSNKSSESTDRTTTAVENVTTSEVTRDSTESTTTSDETTTILVTRLTTSSLNHTETSTAIASKLNDTSVVDSETTEDANSTSTSTKLSKPETPVVRLDISPESSIIGELPAKIQLTDLPIVQPKIKLKKENVTKVSEQVDDRWTLVTKNAESDGKKKQQQQQQQVALDASHSVSGLDASLENTSKDIV
ncbi:mucin-22-like [Prorops nasuta]|uniref:mucin-22-like n=1 Tax=Prorops nasuta TaxID=863751 RepID=UPI0034CD89F9